MIYITGDTHGEYDLEKIEDYFSHEYSSEKDILFILGDGGFVWNANTDSIYQLMKATKATVIYIDGNHENFHLLNEFPIVEKFGAKMHRINSKLFHVLRGEIVSANGLKFLCLGGASSYDKAFRTINVSWWEEENISEDDINNALVNLEKNKYQVDYVLTHCAPSSIVRKMHLSTDNNTDSLEELSKQVCFNKWYFGHYHVDKDIDDKFTCYYQNILKIPVLNEYKKNANAVYYVEDDDGFLIDWKTRRKTKFTPDDLPEYYYKYNEYHNRYVKAFGVVDVAFKQPVFTDHIIKLASIFLSYKKKLPHNEIYEPKNKKDWDYETWRVDTVEFISILEKYNKNLNLHKLKQLANLENDQFVNSDVFEWDDPSTHPFPNEKPIFYKGSKFYVSQDNEIYGIFTNFEDTVKMCELIVQKRNLIAFKRANKRRDFHNLDRFYPFIDVHEIEEKEIDDKFCILKS